MLFNTIDYLLFFTIVLCVNYILPKKVRYIWLLIASYYFYMEWNPWYVFLILGTTVITYLSGVAIEKANSEADRNKKCRTGIVVFCLVVLLAVLGYFKYYDMFLEYLNMFVESFGGQIITRRFEVLLPVGISFYILQSIGYVLDVYRREVEPQRNFLKYALFVAFFPQLVAGPIERTKNLMNQLDKPAKLTWDDFVSGIILICYGVFCKIVIADRIAVIVKNVYGSWETYTGLYIVYAAVLFSFQIYCDFYGYSTIARGSAKLLGISLMDNFNAPYFAKSIKEFWRRWHISLSTWFRDYLYIPLGGNRKGEIRKHTNLLFVFAVSGLWHGASMSFVVWGILNGIYQVLSDVLKKITNCFRKDSEVGNVKFNMVISKNVGFLKWVGTFLIVSFTWIFFAASDMEHALNIIKAMFVIDINVITEGGLFSLGVDKNYTIVLGISIVILMVVDYVKYTGRNVVGILISKSLIIDAIIIILLVFSCLIFGCYGEMYDTQQFIYFQF